MKGLIKRFVELLFVCAVLSVAATFANLLNFVSERTKLSLMLYIELGIFMIYSVFSNIHVWLATNTHKRYFLVSLGGYSLFAALNMSICLYDYVAHSVKSTYIYTFPFSILKCFHISNMELSCPASALICHGISLLIIFIVFFYFIITDKIIIKKKSKKEEPKKIIS